MELILILALMFVTYLIGYRIGYHDCFRMLMQKLKETMDEKTN